MTVAVASLAEEVWDLLLSLSTVPAKYRGDFVDSAGKLTSPPLLGGRCVGYLMAYFGSGRSFSARLGSNPSKVDWSFQVTCAGGTDTRALAVVDAVRGALTGARLHGAIVRELNDPGPLRRDDTVTPSRMYLPLTFGLVANS